MEELKIVKKQLVLDLDKNEAPTAWRWRVDRFLRFDNGQEKIVADEIAATPEEVREHIGAAVLKQAADIAQDSAERETLRGERDAALALVEAVRQADESYDARIKPLLRKRED